MHPRALQIRTLGAALAAAPVVVLGALGAAAAATAAAVAAVDAERRAVAAPPGARVVQGDVFVGDGLAPRGIGYARERTWPDGVVPVWIDPALDPATVDAIERAVAVWNGAAGITVRRIDAEAPPAGDHVHFQPGDGCASWVGRRGGGQELWVSRDCTTGSIVHELGHAIGLEHEHVRPDRDQWIEILWENVIEGKRHNFDVAPAGLETLGAYDYDSIMHYGPDFFSADGSPTIRPLVGEPRIGQRLAPSAGDVAAVAAMYAADLALAGSLEGGELELVASNADARGAHAVELELSPGLAVTAATSAEPWACETPEPDGPADASARCRLERLGPGARSSLALSLVVVAPPGAPAGAPGADARPEAARAGAPAAVDVTLSAVNDDPDRTDNRLSLGPGPGERPVDGPQASAGAPFADDAAGPGASGPEGAPAPELGAGRSPFDVVALAAGAAAARPEAPSAGAPASLATVVATPGAGSQAAPSGGAGGEGRLGRLFGGAGSALPGLVGAALFARRRRGGRRDGPRATR